MPSARVILQYLFAAALCVVFNDDILNKAIHILFRSNT